MDSDETQNGSTSATCVICAYDLRGDPNAICPECGTPRAERERILQGRSAKETRRARGLAIMLGIVALVPWLVNLLAICAAALVEVIAAIFE